jgi:predicted phosphodiesterase
VLSIWFKSYCVAGIIDCMVLAERDAHGDQWSNRHTHMPKWFWTEAQNQLNAGEIAFSITGAEVIGYQEAKKKRERRRRKNEFRPKSHIL